MYLKRSSLNSEVVGFAPGSNHSTVSYNAIAQNLFPAFVFLLLKLFQVIAELCSAVVVNASIVGLDLVDHQGTLYTKHSCMYACCE
jgi:hypothetical protein